MNIIEEFKEYLLKQNLEIKEPATLIEVEQFEQQYKLKLPQILKAYFTLCNGSGEMNCNNEGFSFFTLAEFRPIKDLKGIENFPHANCFVFSEFLLWMTAYAVKLDEYGNELGIYEICNTHNKVCNSFEEFILLIMKDDLEILDR